MKELIWDHLSTDELKSGLKGNVVKYLEILNVQSMSCGLYYLPEGSKDMQTPHEEDEIYFVLEGRAHISLDEESREVVPGSLLYVKAAVEHNFFEIEEDMLLLVMFSNFIPHSKHW